MPLYWFVQIAHRIFLFFNKIFQHSCSLALPCECMQAATAPELPLTNSWKEKRQTKALSDVLDFQSMVSRGDLT